MFISRVIKLGSFYLDISAHLDHTAGDLVAAGLEADLHEPPEPGGVIITDRLGVAESFKDGVGLEDLLLDPGRDVCRHAEIKTIQLFFIFWADSGT